MFYFLIVRGMQEKFVLVRFQCKTKGFINVFNGFSQAGRKFSVKLQLVFYEKNKFL